jgi:hypothetical protein
MYEVKPDRKVIGLEKPHFTVNHEAPPEKRWEFWQHGDFYFTGSTWQEALATAIKQQFIEGNHRDASRN